MADGLFSKPQISWDRLFALLVLIGVAASFYHPLTSSRPPAPQRVPHLTDSPIVVDARLWQNPLDAVRRELDARAHEIHDYDPRTDKQFDLDALREQLSNHLPHDTEHLPDEPSPPKPIILPVFVDGSPYAEDAEFLLRTRYAVLSALSHDYAPEDDRHIGCVICPAKLLKPPYNPTTAPSTTAPTTATAPAPTTAPATECASQPASCSSAKSAPGTNEQLCCIPYEWWIPKDHSKRAPCLVLWVDVQDFDTYPIKKLFKVLQAIGIDSVGNEASACPVRIIGPPASTYLKQFADDLHCVGANSNLKVFSPWATSENARKYFAGLDESSYELNIASDTELVAALVDELHLRKAAFNATTGAYFDHLAIVAESDTVYARELDQDFTQKIYDPTHKHLYISYFRGIDGSIPTPARPKVPSLSDPAQLTSDSLDNFASEAPDGQSQMDYLRRLATDLHRREDDLKRTTDNHGFFAIGILGTDVYDKLPVLQALRDEFPEAIFFTTDLDARYTFPPEMGTTHNLVIASAYDLTLIPELQGSTPPFRDCYQTAAFYATLRAVGADSLSQFEICHKTSLRQAATVQTFEISRYGPFNLNLPVAVDDNESPELNPPPATESLLRSGRVGLLGILLIIAALALVLSPGLRATVIYTCDAVPVIRLFVQGLVSTATPPDEKRKYRITGIILFFFLIAVIAVACLAFRDNADGKGEPFGFVLGISVWPTEMIRVFVCFLAFLFFWHSRRKMIETFNSVRQRFHLDDPPDDTPVKSPPPTRHIWLRCWKPPETPPTATLIWKEYTEFGREPARIARGALLFLLFFGLSWLTMATLGYPVAPIRGWRSDFFDKAAIFCAICALLALCAFVVDAVQICRILVENLTDHVTTWPNAAYKDPAHHIDADSYLLDAQFFAEITTPVATLIYYPFFLLCFVIVARLPIFDNWHWTAPLILTNAVPLLASLFACWNLANSAANARKVATEELQKLALKEPAQKPHIDEIINEITNLKSGAFAAWYEQPWIVSVLIPFGGFALIATLEYFLSLRLI